MCLAVGNGYWRMVAFERDVVAVAMLVYLHNSGSGTHCGIKLLGVKVLSDTLVNNHTKGFWQPLVLLRKVSENIRIVQHLNPKLLGVIRCIISVYLHKRMACG